MEFEFESQLQYSPAMRHWTFHLIREKEFLAAVRRAGRKYRLLAPEAWIPVDALCGLLEHERQQQEPRAEFIASCERKLSALRRASEIGLAEQYRLWVLLEPDSDWSNYTRIERRDEMRVRAGVVWHQVRYGGILKRGARARQYQALRQKRRNSAGALSWTKIRLELHPELKEKREGKTSRLIPYPKRTMPRLAKLRVTGSLWPKQMGGR